MTSPSNLPHDDTNDDVSDAASAPVAEAPTPARKQTKRKAPQDDTADTTTKKPKTLVHTEQAASTSTSASGKKTTQRHRAVRIEIPASSISTPSNKAKHIVFNNNDADAEEDQDQPSEFFTPQEDVKTNPLEAQLSQVATTEAANEAEEEKEENESSDDDDDDDDEAPEAVSTSTAAAQAAKATQAAARAVEVQQDVERRKRQERDAKFRKQAEARKKQQQDSAAKTAEKKEKKKKQGNDESESESDDEDDNAAATKPKPESRLVTSLATSSRKRLDRRNLPSVLPDEFLASDSEAEEEDHHRGGSSSSSITTGRPKKITFNTAARQVGKSEPRHPADQRVGATVYRVMKKQGETKLAPKGGKYSKNAKEMLLGRGRTVPKTGVKKKGFLVR